jgi:hypothetical protein
MDDELRPLLKLNAAPPDGDEIDVEVYRPATSIQKGDTIRFLDHPASPERRVEDVKPLGRGSVRVTLAAAD